MNDWGQLGIGFATLAVLVTVLRLWQASDRGWREVVHNHLSEELREREQTRQTLQRMADLLENIRDRLGWRAECR
jgi:hypothetical protein